jgi:hypothetical protein
MKLLLGSTALAIALGLGAYPAGPAAAQQIQYACDENGDGFVDATESRLCTEREFDEIAAGEQALTEEQLSALSEGQEGMPAFRVRCERRWRDQPRGMERLRRARLRRRDRGERRSDKRRRVQRLATAGHAVHRLNAAARAREALRRADLGDEPSEGGRRATRRAVGCTAFPVMGWICPPARRGLA